MTLLSVRDLTVAFRTEDGPLLAVGAASFDLGEREVLALVAKGLTNRQIAAELFISVKTAGAHVSNILTKLGVARRAQAAAIAERLRLSGDRTMAGIGGFLLSSTIGWFLPGLPFLGAYYTLGASASIFGLIGGAAYYGRRTGSRLASSQAWSYAISMGVYSFILGGGMIDNAAHIGGFAGGYLAGRLLDPLKPERIDHLVIAGICLLASVGAKETGNLHR